MDSAERATNDLPKSLFADDVAISRVGFGAWAIGGPYENGWGPVDDDVSVRAILRAVDLGVNWIDTAPAYGHGHSESVVGKALNAVGGSARPLIFTKCGRTWPGGKITSDLRPKSIRKQCEDSLRRLSVERIDLYQIHRPDSNTGTPIEESWGELAHLADEGKVRWIGVSNCDQEFIERCDRVRAVDSFQPRISIVDQSALALAGWCRKQGIAVLGYSPLGSGLLTGKFSPKNLAPGDWRINSSRFNGASLDRGLALVDTLESVGANKGKSVIDLALGWVLARDEVTATIVGARRSSQVDEWVRAASNPLSKEVIEILNTI
ncbi:aldo/keto reductase [Nocardia sp. XZ_19_385]|uniref:aldo/keto reductase n=1 Tax=Nocardia sp. XZ_19_385 TaxID=2769488 RepID=UPI00188E5788|nr:aldo/keto reductase [Nocardia sp. XZ_19_385]